MVGCEALGVLLISTYQGTYLGRYLSLCSTWTKKNVNKLVPPKGWAASPNLSHPRRDCQSDASGGIPL